MRLFFTIAFVFLCFFGVFFAVQADEYDDLTKQLSDLKGSLDSSKKATATNQKELDKLNAQLNSIKAKVGALEGEIAQKEKEVKEGEEALGYQKILLNQRAISYYKNINKNTFSVVELLVSEDISRSLENFFYQKSLQEEDRRSITKIATYIKNLEEKKASLLVEHDKLAVIKKEVDKQSSFLAGEVDKAKKYQGELQQKIAALNARQQEIVAGRQAGLNIPRSAGTSARGCSDDRPVDPGFSPRFAFFTYGAPHRKGLNQYGAFGRAKAGQNEEDILKAYYPNMSLKKDYDQGTKVNVDGYGEFSIEDYVKHIFEVPNSWGDEGGMAALKAQAVAARSYALNSQKRNGHICTTEACQVFHSETKGGNWDAAVEATKGWVMMDGDSPGFTEYASTHGGYIINLSKFDGRDGTPGNFSDWNDRAYDKESPWFYCDWGSRSEYNKTAWLKSSEIADIVNIILLVKQDSGTTNHLYQPDKPNPAGSDTWDAERVKSELRSHGTNPFNNVSEVSISPDFGGGKTSSITLSGDGGSVNFSGAEFKDWFNLRAPANLQIVGPLFNIERR